MIELKALVVQITQEYPWSSRSFPVVETMRIMFLEGDRTSQAVVPWSPSCGIKCGDIVAVSIDVTTI